MIKVLTEELARADERFTTIAADNPDVTRLMTLPGIGPITATAYVAALDDAARFRRAGQVASYLGLVPSEYRSGEQPRRGRVRRSAHPHVQSLLVQAAWRISRSTDPRTAALRAGAQGLARRRGQKIAIVALARHLARILFAMWRDGIASDGARIRPTPRHGAAPIGEDASKLALGCSGVQGVKLEESARCGHLAAVASRPVACATPPRILSCAGTARATSRAYKRVNHLAVILSEETELDATLGW